MTTAPKDIAFNNASKNRDYNIFTEEFYGGTDTFIYINGERYENISAIQFAVREQQKPIYGYSSRVYDDLATGTRIVQGAIKVPVKNEGPKDKLERAANLREAQYAAASYNTNEYSVPDWVYKYTPNVEELGSPNEAFQLDDKNKSVIADVQSKLIKHGLDLEVTGIIDNKTKFAIASYKKDMDLTVNNKCDLELENRLSVHESKYIYVARGNIKLRYMPTSSSPSSLEIKNGEQLVVQGIVDDKWFLVQSHLGRKGYIRQEEALKV